MKSIDILKARIRRNKLDTLSGDYYRDEHSVVVQYLNGLGKNALVGIQREDGVYTIIGLEKVYYLNQSKVECEISIKDFLIIFNRTTLVLGKTTEYEFIKINEKDFLWVMNIYTMNAICNTVLFFDKL
jgi:hypothetical protein